MKSSKTSYRFKRFEDLKILIEKKSSGNTPLSHKKKMLSPKPPHDNRAPLTPREEHYLFMKAMEGVIPLKNRNTIEAGGSRISTVFPDSSDQEIIQKLKQLIRRGTGFRVSDTSEYEEGIGHNVNPDVTRRLHEGEYAIQDHLDLHGHNVASAKYIFDEFLQDSVSNGKLSVLIIHGRGLSSPDHPVLKYKVIQWLTSGKWRKWIVAFSSARSCDGGAGATYVLLRKSPLPKRFRKMPNV